MSSDKTLALNAFAKLRKHFFSDAFSAIYAAIQIHYTKYNEMPSLDTLMIESNRNSKLSHALAVLSNTSIPDAELIFAISMLEDEFTQNEVLRLIDEDLLVDLVYLDKGEIINRISSLAIKLEEKVSTSETVFNANRLKIFNSKETSELKLIPLCLSNTWDSTVGGIGRGEVIIIGGYRGTGKSIVCSNIQVNQYKQGNVPPYFTIEMKASEVFSRNLSIMAGVSALDMRTQSLAGAELLRLARTRAAMFNGGTEFFNNYVNKYTIESMQHFDDMENELNSKFELHTDMIIIEDRNLTTAKIDVDIGNAVARYGTKVTLGIVDYLNQVAVEGTKSSEMYDWVNQMNIGKHIKNIAIKHDVGMCTPIQTDKDGKVRLSQGILDSCDVAANLNAAKADNGKGAIIFSTIKARGMPESVFSPAIDWNTLTIDQTQNLTDLDLEQMQAKFVIEREKPAKAKKASRKEETSGEDSRELEV